MPDSFLADCYILWLNKSSYSKSVWRKTGIDLLGTWPYNFQPPTPTLCSRTIS